MSLLSGIAGMQDSINPKLYYLGVCKLFSYWTFFLQFNNCERSPGQNQGSMFHLWLPEWQLPVFVPTGSWDLRTRTRNRSCQPNRETFFWSANFCNKNGQELNPALSSLHWCILGFLSFLFIQRSMFLPTLYPHYYCLVLRHSCSKTIHFFKSKLLCPLLTFSFVPNTLFLRL